jgi:predicted GIY-YIG superfamily endonuclease
MINAKKRKSSKGALIKGMTKRLPIAILENEIFRMRLREIMRGYAGIYAMYKKNELYYVGLTKNLFGRLKTHRLRDRHAGKWDEFIIFRIKKVNYLKDIETLLTHLVELKGNRVKGKVPLDGDINKVLSEILSEHKMEIRGIEKALRK